MRSRSWKRHQYAAQIGTALRVPLPSPPAGALQLDAAAPPQLRPSWHWPQSVQRLRWLAALEALLLAAQFAVGVDFNLFSPGEIATTAWDGYCTVWNVSEGQARPTRLPNRPRPAAMKGLAGLARPTIPL